MSGPLKTAIYSKRVFLPEGLQEATVFIENGQVSGYLLGKQEPSGTSFTDFGDQVVMPGIVDTHVHLNEPGRAEWEGFHTGTMAAVAGGITSLVEMPLNSSPVTTTSAALIAKLDAARGKMHCNCGFWGGVIPGNADEIEKLAAGGVRGFKAFLTHSGIDEFPNVTLHDLRLAMPLIAATELPLLVHCELESPVDLLVTDRRSYEQYLSSRPPKWEEDAIALMINLCREFNCKVHVVHLSAASALPMIRRAKEEGLPITVETGQHYLYFSAEQIGDGETKFKCAPPIRSEANRRELWSALKSGLIDFVATDHSPAPPALKETASGDFQKAWGGISSLQDALPALWTKAAEEGCSIAQVSNWLSRKPAHLAGLTSKGAFLPGADADFVVWDPEEKFVVSAADNLHKHKITPYEGEMLTGVVKQTWLRGQLIYVNKRLLQPASGEIL